MGFFLGLVTFCWRRVRALEDAAKWELDRATEADFRYRRKRQGFFQRLQKSLIVGQSRAISKSVGGCNYIKHTALSFSIGLGQFSTNEVYPKKDFSCQP